MALYLPNVKREKTFTSDFMVHPTALAHLRRRSGFVNDLLRNDSLLDMTSRDTIYRALLDWLEIVANHEALAAMLAMPQMRPMMTEPGPDENTVTVTYEGRPSPRELLETIVIQATSALKGLSATAVPETPPAPTPADGAVDNNPFLANATVKETADSEHAKNVALKVFWYVSFFWTLLTLVSAFCLRVTTSTTTLPTAAVKTLWTECTPSFQASVAQTPLVAPSFSQLRRRRLRSRFVSAATRCIV